MVALLENYFMIFQNFDEKNNSKPLLVLYYENYLSEGDTKIMSNTLMDFETEKFKKSEKLIIFWPQALIPIFASEKKFIYHNFLSFCAILAYCIPNYLF